jgi:tetratricopeptide (TPR) repeat protein
MRLRHRFYFLPACLIALLSSIAGAQSSGSNAELNLGVQAYKHAKWEEAIDHFERAVAQDAGNVRARLYLGTAYAQQYVPGVDTADNNEMGERALEQYKKVIELAPPKADTLSAVKSVAYLYLQKKKFDDAKEYYRKATELDPEDPESYYSIGVIDWTETYQPRQEERANLGIKPDEALSAKNPQVCDMLRAKNWVTIQEGIEDLNKAIQLRPDYDDAMAYLNLMYRERADVQCDDPAAREADLQTADVWVDKTMATKKVKAAKAAELEKQLSRAAPKQ